LWNQHPEPIGSRSATPLLNFNIRRDNSIVGAVVGGFLFSIFGATGITGFNIYSLIVAIIGSVVVLWLYHQLVGRRRI